MGNSQSWYTTRFYLWSPFFPNLHNDVSDNLVSTGKLFADDFSLFSVVRDSNISATKLNNDI